MLSTKLAAMQSSATISSTSLGGLLKAIFIGVEADVFSAYSEYGQPIQRFQDCTDLRKFADTTLATPKGFLNLAVRYADSGPPARIREIALNPSKCSGHTVRYSADGWGLIQIQCDAKNLPLLDCRIAVNSQKRAIAWRDNYPEMGDPGEWDWKVVEKHTRRLIRVLKKLESGAGNAAS